MYTADLRGSKYSPLDQINASNFSKLEVAWRFKTDNLGPRPENKLEGTPIMVKGMVYATAGTRRSVVALDPKNGELKWVYSMDEGERATRWAPRQLSGRGLSYWTDGRGDERIIYVTTGYRLVELNAKTGQPVASFGQNGVVDLKVGVVIGKDKQIDLEKGEIGLHSTPTVVNDMVIVGSSMFEGLGYRYSTNSKGLVRAFDVKTGKQLWRFNTIPGPGEFGNDTWENGSWEWTGNIGVWTQISVDPEAGLVYLPVETPTIDEYGGNRPGNNLFAEIIVAVDLKTGVRKWHFQQVHHGLWDHDNSSASLLIDATIDGQPRKLLAQPTKQGWLYVFDRITGQPIWPIAENAGSADRRARARRRRRRSRFRRKPPPYSRTFVSKDDLIDFTPQLRAAGARQPEASTAGSSRRSCRRRLAEQWRQVARRDQHRQHRRRRQLAGLRLRSGNRRSSTRRPPMPASAPRASAAKSSSSSASENQKTARQAALGSGSGTTAAFGTNQPGSAATQAPRRSGRRGTWPRRRAGRGGGRGAGGGGGGRGGLTAGPRRSADREAAVRRDLGHRSEHRHAEVPGAARRHA